MNKISLFSGIGGDDLASEACGIETICFVERDKECRKVLAAHWPGIPIIKDVKDVTKESAQGQENNTRWADCGQYNRDGVGNDLRNICDPRGFRIDIISGGFPCQPHSVAGLRKGSADERDLWGEFRRIIGEFNPRWVVAENVPGLFSTDSGRFFRGILRDLSAMGYSVGWCTFGAVDVGAWHRRDRVFIVAYSIDSRGRTSGLNINGIWQEINKGQNEFSLYRSDRYCQDVPHSTCGQNIGREGRDMESEAAGRQGINSTVSTGCADVCDSTINKQPRDGRTRGRRAESTNDGTRYSQSRVGDMVNGLSQWMAEPDGVPRIATGVKARVAKLKALGNAVVPQQIYPIYRAIVDIEARV